MGASKLTSQERADRKRLAARIRQQRCRARKRKAERDAAERAQLFQKSKLTKIMKSLTSNSFHSTHSLSNHQSLLENVHHFSVTAPTRHNSPHSVALSWSFDEGNKKFSSTTSSHCNIGFRTSPKLCLNELTAIHAMLSLSNENVSPPVKQQTFSSPFYDQAKESRQLILANEQAQFSIRPSALYHFYSH